MAYRSDVKFVIVFNDAVRAAVFRAKAVEDYTSIIHPEWGYATEEEAKADAERVLVLTDRQIRYSANNVKWYESYPDVMFFECLLDKSEAAGAEYRFIRIGEDDSDVEVKQSRGDNFNLYDDAYSALSLVRSSEFN